MAVIASSPNNAGRAHRGSVSGPRSRRRAAVPARHRAAACRVPRNGGGRAQLVRSPWVAISLLWAVLITWLPPWSGQVSGARFGLQNTQCRYSRNLMTVATRLAAIGAETSVIRPGWAGPESGRPARPMSG